MSFSHNKNIWKISEKYLKIPEKVVSGVFHYIWEISEKYLRNIWEISEKCLKNIWNLVSGVFQKYKEIWKIFEKYLKSLPYESKNIWNLSEKYLKCFLKNSKISEIYLSPNRLQKKLHCRTWTPATTPWPEKK